MFQPPSGELALQNVLDTTALQRLIHLAEPVHEEHVVGAERAIDHELADPMAVGFLLSEEIPLRERDRFRQFLVRGLTRYAVFRDPGQSDDICRIHSS